MKPKLLYVNELYIKKIKLKKLAEIISKTNINDKEIRGKQVMILYITYKKFL